MILIVSLNETEREYSTQYVEDYTWNLRNES